MIGSAVPSESSAIFAFPPLRRVGSDSSEIRNMVKACGAGSMPAHGWCWIVGGQVVRWPGCDDLSKAEAVGMGLSTAASTGMRVEVGRLIGRLDGGVLLAKSVVAAEPTETEDLISRFEDMESDLLSDLENAAVLNPKKPRDRRAIVRALALAMLGRARKWEAKSLKRGLAMLDADWPDLSSHEREDLINAAADSIRGVGVSAAPGLVVAIGSTQTRVAQAVRAVARETYNFDIKASFSLADRAAISRTKTTAFSWLTNEYGQRAKGFEAAGRKAVSEGLAKGFGRAEIAEDLQGLFGGAISGRSEAYFRVYSGAVVDRARSMGELMSYRDAGIQAYEASAVLDEATTDFCFAAGSPVLLRQGEVPIEDVLPGMEARTGSGHWRRVLKVSKRTASDWWCGNLMSGRRLLGTTLHRILASNGWTRAGLLWPGSRLAKAPREAFGSGDIELSETEYLACCGGFDCLSSVARSDRERDAYNLEIEGDPTYVVSGIVVHNCRWVDGKVLDVDKSLEVAAAAEDPSLSPEQMKLLNPWVREQKIRGALMLSVNHASGLRNIAQVVSSGAGTQSPGVYRSLMRVDDLYAIGIGFPPYHALCRTSVTPVVL